MRNIKMLGLAVAAAAILTALIGAGSASATVLCTAKPETTKGTLVCPAGKVYTGKNYVGLGSMTITGVETDFFTLTCSTVRSGTQINKGGETIAGEMLSISAQFCKFTKTPFCTLQFATGSPPFPTSLKYLSTEGKNGQYQQTEFIYQIVYICYGGLFSCVYKANEGIEGGFYNEGNLIKVDAILTPVESTFGCKKSTLHLEQKITTGPNPGEGSPLYVAQE